MIANASKSQYVTRPSKVPRVGSFDALRTFAALLVLLVHIRFPCSPGSWLGPVPGKLAVDFFFVLSGFVIALNYWDRCERRSVMRYLQARFARIYPLHFITLLLWLGIECLNYWAQTRLPWAPTRPAFSDSNLRSFILHLTLLNAHGLTTNQTFNIPAWSIGAEASCYLLFAAVLLLGKSSGAKIGMLVCAGALAAVCLPNVHPTICGVFRGVLGFCLGAVWWTMMRGFVTGLYPGHNPTGASLRRERWMIPALGLCIAVSAGAFWADLPYPGIHLFSVGVIGLCAMRVGGRVHRILERLGDSWLGQISFGIYLWHTFVLWIANRVLSMVFHYPTEPGTQRTFLCPLWVGNLTLLATMVATVGVAYLSFRYFESPWRRRLRPSPELVLAPSPVARDSLQFR